MIPLPDHRDIVVVCGTSVRKPKAILEAYLNSLAWQNLPPRVRLVPVFVPDFVAGMEDAQELLFRWTNERGGTLIQGFPPQAQDFSDAPEFDSHQWGQSAMARVGAQKNQIINYALSIKADYVFFCDADLILDKYTIGSLIDCEKPIVTATYWTRWSKKATEGQRVPASPQVWLRHPYFLDGRGQDEAEFRDKLLSRNVQRVWGFGACTLINRRVLEAGLNFDYLPDVPKEGLMGGEDRHFCIRAERMHIDAYADSYPDIFHVYHADQDVPKIPEVVARLARDHPETASRGDLVSLRLRPLEPLPVAPGRVQHSPAIQIRGRLGQIGLLPQIEEAVYELKRSEKKIVKVSFPISSPVGFLRGRQRLIEVSLLDVKPFGYSPVVEDDLLVGPKSGAYVA